MFVPVEERWDSHDHLEDEDAKRPPVNGEVVAVSYEHLGGQVLGSAAERVSQLTLLDELGQAEVGHKEVTVFANKHIFRLEITIDDTLRMEMSEGKRNLCRKELGLVLGEHAHLDKMTEELATFDKFHQEVDAVLVLEHVLHVNQERMVNLAEDVLLKLDVLHLFVLEDDVLADDLHGVRLLGRLVLNKEDFAECSLTYHLLYGEIRQRGGRIVFAREQGCGSTRHRLAHLCVV